MMYIVPLIIWEIKAETKPTFYRILNLAIIAIAFFYMIYGIYDSVIELKKDFN